MPQETGGLIEIVSATRVAEADFLTKTALGRSLRRLAHDKRLVARIAYANSRPLPEVFNARLSAADGADVVVFVHDDVWLDDYFLADRVIEGLRSYDVIGLAGNRRRVPGQPAWLFVDAAFRRDDPRNLSGSVAHGPYPFGTVSAFGPAPAECELLDGVFLACRKSVVAAKGVAFDPRFDFHFYDLDFCRTARAKGLRLGTWPICITHQSEGAFNNAPWKQRYRDYLEKWGG